LASSAEPQDSEQAAAAVAAAAQFLRKEDPRNPIPYLLLRSLRWGEVRGTDDRIDPLLLEAPRSEERKTLRSLFLEEQWQELLEATEEVMASEAGRGWLDLQRYAILAADHMGSDFSAVTAALRGALQSHLLDLPSLATATLMDDSAAASADTRQWLEAAGFLAPNAGVEGEGPATDDTDPDKVRLDASFARAEQMVQAGDPDGAIRLLMGRAERETSERATFVTRGEAARIMVERGETSVARPILEELLGDIDRHSLEEWESGEVVAKPMGLLLRCLDPGEGPRRQQIYERICRLDPLLARELRDAGHGD
jgi:type VI secretion system protein ImpA